MNLDYLEYGEKFYVKPKIVSKPPIVIARKKVNDSDYSVT